ncbi:bifunctional adenosylcobinamide kinase/adenosylcobinamide-phosphate guanylyltransferase [Cohnella sp. REN36]|uniref:bifunctional adenosylcobinamide kinase/adenosylcobinamide-phosphate guanylyltransferase n=1 Tax=Cohnella sp. REN36 TaxID=2887347 RepID=UPI001D151168|nr:bifunctional adenosylcobinamide kinase/adenosylcobinamide-phosphate guanylyltransferase [Cohnella sp. REN36]MCC3376896.1 bifunctional adenosylcobinamide kinase/adenosylcobinamide-phosphate guanylyltransferase [Cohnella sp. REN36]
MIVLVTGGARSGKSAFAERYAALHGREGVYVATSEALDEEMARRIALHRAQRERSGFAWRTVEEPLDLAGTLLRLREKPVVLVDCLTLWLSNHLLREEGQADAEARIEERMQTLAEALGGMKGCVILVTNEVGDGVVPAYPLGRVYRDLAGVLNRQIAAVSDEVFLVTAGIPVELKRLAFAWPGAGASP